MAVEAMEAAKNLGFSELLVKRLLRNKRSGYEDYDDEMGLLLPAIHVTGFNTTIDQLLLLIKKNVLVTLHTREVTRFFRVRRYAETFFKKYTDEPKTEDRLTLMLIRIHDENNSRNFEHLQEIEEAGDSLSPDLSNIGNTCSPLGGRIYEMKYFLIIYLSGLWSTADAFSSLRYGDADLISDDPRILDWIGVLLDEVHSHIGLAEHLSEVLASGLECFQSIYNNQLQILNNRISIQMGYLTIIGTALLVPNTIATVLSQTNIFTFSNADAGWYLTLIVASTIIVTIAAYIVVKRMGYLPSSVDDIRGNKF